MIGDTPSRSRNGLVRGLFAFLGTVRGGRCAIDALLVGLIWLLIYALVIGLFCYIVVRLASQFMPGFAPFAWVVWCIGGLILLILALRLFSPLLHL